VIARRPGFDHRGKVFLITGAAGGIGSALCRAVAVRGAQVAAVDRDAERLAELVQQLPGVGHLPVAADLTRREDLDRLLAAVAARYRRIDVLVNNAAMTSAERFDERSVASIEDELALNLLSPLVLTRLAVPLLRAGDDPRVVTTVSLGGIFPLGETPIYTASKFGLRGAMLSIALDLRAKGIIVGSVLPSATDTPMLRKEALDGGNTLQFQDPPQTPEHVVRSMLRMLDRPRLERYPRPSESWLVRVAMLSPNLLPRLMPLFRGRGDRGLVRYLSELERRGLIRRTPTGRELVG